MQRPQRNNGWTQVLICFSRLWKQSGKGPEVEIRMSGLRNGSEIPFLDPCPKESKAVLKQILACQD